MQLQITDMLSVQTINRPPPATPVTDQFPAAPLINPPVTDALAAGRVHVRDWAEHVRIVQEFGAGALAVSPRVGHVHVTLDHVPWHWADASGEQLIETGLPIGRHKVLLELVDAAHRTVDARKINFLVPVAAIQADRP